WSKSSSRARSSALNRTTYFLTATSFAATNHLRRWIATTVIQNTPSNAMTRGTSLPAENLGQRKRDCCGEERVGEHDTADCDGRGRRACSCDKDGSHLRFDRFRLLLRNDPPIKAKDDPA